MRVYLLLVTCFVLLALQDLCQCSPHLSFNGQTLSNNSDLDIHQVGTSDTNSVQCHTHLVINCCNDSRFESSWYFPNGTKLPWSGAFYQSHKDGQVDLKRNGTAGYPTGKYQCCVMTNSSPSCVEVHVIHRGTLFQLRFTGPLTSCTDFINSERYSKLEDVTAAVVNTLKVSCEECSSENIDGQFFVCYPESPSFVTYRARLEGTSERDSFSLVSLIEEWVSGGEARLIVTGVLMTLDPHCSVTICDINEDECSSETSSAPDSINRAAKGGAVGGVIATINIVALCVVIVLIFLRYRYGPISLRTVVKWALGKFDNILSVVLTGRPIDTSSNEVYAEVNEGGRQQSEGEYEPVAIAGSEPSSGNDDNPTPQESVGDDNGDYVVMASSNQQL